jgi:hypothetical protein
MSLVTRPTWGNQRRQSFFEDRIVFQVFNPTGIEFPLDHLPLLPYRIRRVVVLIDVGTLTVRLDNGSDTISTSTTSPQAVVTTLADDAANAYIDTTDTLNCTISSVSGDPTTMLVVVDITYGEETE